MRLRGRPCPWYNRGTFDVTRLPLPRLSRCQLRYSHGFSCVISSCVPNHTLKRIASQKVVILPKINREGNYRSLERMRTMHILIMKSWLRSKQKFWSLRLFKTGRNGWLPQGSETAEAGKNQEQNMFPSSNGILVPTLMSSWKLSTHHVKNKQPRQVRLQPEQKNVPLFCFAQQHASPRIT